MPQSDYENLDHAINATRKSLHIVNDEINSRLCQTEEGKELLRKRDHFQAKINHLYKQREEKAQEVV